MRHGSLIALALSSCASPDDGAHPAVREPAPVAPGIGLEGAWEQGGAPEGAEPFSSVSENAETKVTASDGGAGYFFGGSVASAGDLDGDGHLDMMVGAMGASTSGAVYVYHGSSTGLDLASEQKLEPSAGLTLSYGGDVHTGGDLDGDGYDDVVIGASGSYDYGAYSGAVYLLYGSSTGLDPSSEERFVASDGDERNYLGHEVVGGGDFDGDGYDDLASTARGHDGAGTFAGNAYVWYGTSTGAAAGTEQGFTASDASDYMGFGVDLAVFDDLDADGYADLAVASYTAVYVYFGSYWGVDTSSEQKIEGASPSAAIGSAVADLGDVNADGYDDLGAGAYQYNGLASDSGAVYVYLGSASGIDLGSEQRLEASDPAEDAQLGCDLAGLGDLDGDGYDDLLAMAYTFHHDPRSGAGVAYVWYGSSTGVDASSEERLTASDREDDDYFGGSAAGLGDLDADGYADIAIAAAGDDDLGDVSGAVYLYAGGTTDKDGDGHETDTDCDDEDASVYPGAAETVADGIDSDCDGLELCHADADGDTWTLGTVTSADLDCTGSGEAATASASEDCDDGDGGVHPGAGEVVADGVDQDCDGGDLCHVDADGDGYTGGTVASADLDCTDSGELAKASSSEDCDDGDASVYPHAPEHTADGLDSNCDGRENCHGDDDGDGYTGSIVESDDLDCTGEGEFATPSAETDCDDGDPDIHPGAYEYVADEVDSDCDGGEICYADVDGDGFMSGQVTSTDSDCQDAGEIANPFDDEDCDDGDAAVYPGAAEQTANGKDDDCDGFELCLIDGDGDGFAGMTGELLSVDMDCRDGDERDWTMPGSDCDDSDGSVHPAAYEGVGDEFDQDCDGGELCYADMDGDGFHAGGIIISADLDCDDANELEDAGRDGDCDDNDPSLSPGLYDQPGDGIDQDCDGRDAGTDGTGQVPPADPPGCASAGSRAGAGLLWVFGLFAVRRRRSG